MKKITLLLLILLAQHSRAQDTCASAVPITATGTFVIDAVNGTEVPSPVCAQNGAITNANPHGEWYKYTPTSDYTVTVTSDLPINSGKDTRFHVYTGSCGSLTCYAGDDDSGANLLSTATFNVAAGSTYYIAWDNRWSSAGFSFQVIENPVVVPPPTPITYNNQIIGTNDSTYKLCIVDMNGDHLDDIVGVSQGNLKVHYQQAGGTFTIANYPVSGTSMMPGWSMAAGDLNKDGYNDLLLGSGSGLTFWVSNNTGTAYTSVTPGDYIFCQRTNFVDINNDGNLDAFSCHDVDPNVYYLNNGAGTYTYYQSGVTPGAYSLGVLQSGGNYASLWSDFDNDGDSDMFISKCSGPPCELHRNDGNGVFTDISAIAQINVQPIQTWSSAVADFDNDGDMDILIGSNGGSGNRLFRNNLDTTNNVEEPFTNITAGSGWETNVTNRDYISYDFDNDGWIDVLAGGSRIMFNVGNNQFAAVSYPSITVGAVGDLNNDGFLDIMNGTTVRYGVPNGNNWLTVALQGVQSNSNGIGARLEIYGSWGKQIRDVRSGEGFGYMSTLNTHFGIGASTVIDKLIIRWPSGTVDVVMNPQANQQLFVIEGSSPLAVGEHNESPFSLFPNPAKDFLNITGTANREVKHAEVFDMTGRLVFSSELTEQRIPVQKLTSGSYIILLEDVNGKRFSQKFLKQ
ncbi:MAG: T9SS type A sorting domain-containing protein [Flavobacterium sp.]|nr:MAG: T9SS type A sorting domain-containing protein [Flavobacterium sp.]